MTIRTEYRGCTPTVTISQKKLILIMVSSAISFTTVGFIVGFGMWLAINL